MNRESLAAIIIVFYLLLIVVLVPYARGVSPYRVTVYDINGDVIYHDDSYTVISNSSGTWIISGDEALTFNQRSVDACRTSWGIVLASSRNPYLWVVSNGNVSAYRIPVNLARPSHVACSNSTAYAIGGDTVRGSMLYLIQQDSVRVYKLPDVLLGVEDLGIGDAGLLIVKSSLLAVVAGGTVTVYNLTVPGWRVDLNLAQEGNFLLGSIRREPSRLAFILGYPGSTAWTIEVVGRAALASAYIEDDRMVALVRPAGSWALLVEWNEDGLKDSVSTVMSDAFTLTSTGSLGDSVWLGGRLLGSMRSIVVEASSATPGLVGEEYRIIVNAEEYKGMVAIKRVNVNFETVSSGKLERIADLGSPEPEDIARVYVDYEVYVLSRDLVVDTMTLAALSIPAGMAVYNLLLRGGYARGYI